MVEQEQVEIAVAVVIEEQRLGRIALEIEPVLLGPVGERPVAVVDVQHVAAVNAQVIDTADEDVEKAVAVHVGYRYAVIPADRIVHSPALVDILELSFTPIQPQPIPTYH